MGESTTPREVVEAARRGSCRSIAYTYTEPTVFFEFAYETAKLAHAAGIRNVFVTNGYMTPEALEMIHPCLDAANVDLKAYSETYYADLCGARLEPVKETLRLMKSLGVFVEVTTLIVPGLNDSQNELEQMAQFLVNDLGPETPWHISRFHPTYRLTDRPPTPMATLLTAREIGLKAGLRYVYTGNVPGHDSENTFCYQCGKMVIERQGFQLRNVALESGCCRYCQTPVDGVDL